MVTMLQNEQFIVNSVTVNAFFDVIVEFNNGATFLTFTDTSVYQEQWRLFSKGSKKRHIVAYFNDIELE